MHLMILTSMKKLVALDWAVLHNVCLFSWIFVSNFFFSPQLAQFILRIISVNNNNNKKNQNQPNEKKAFWRHQQQSKTKC